MFDPFLLPTLLVETRQKREGANLSFGSLRVISTAAAAAFLLLVFDDVVLILMF